MGKRMSLHYDDDGQISAADEAGIVVSPWDGVNTFRPDPDARADIVSVGYFDGDNLHDWAMDCRGRAVAAATYDDNMEVRRLGGWTIAELRQIAAEYPRGAFVSGLNQEAE